MSASSPPHQQHFGAGSWTAATNTTTSSLGLLQLLRQRGISASFHPHHNVHCSDSTRPSGSAAEAKDGGGGSSWGKEGRRNLFSLNLVEKLQGLGLHRVAAWGMTRRDEAEAEKKPDGR